MGRVIVVTGANRGIGLELCRQYAADGAQVHATARRRSDELERLTREGRVIFHELDVTDPASIDALRGKLSGTAVDLLINNAGITGGGDVGRGRFSLEDATMETLVDAYRTNAAGPLLLTRALLRSIAMSTERKVVMMTSRMGSIGDGPSGGYYPYRMSKAAMNMMGHNLAHDVRADGVTVIMMHPGWVKTDMGGPAATIDVGKAVARMRQVIDRVTLAETGRFLDLDGKTMPW